MVLEGYLSRFLVERFGRYVKGLDAENLRLSVWKGEVRLSGLQLVPEALSESLDLPVDVKWGHVGLFHLSVPWSKLGSKPVRVTLEEVYILVAPLDTWGMDEMERQRRARYQKFRGVEWRLRKHLERKALMQNMNKAAAGRSKGMWGRMLAKIIDNVQITIKNIHLRYEDELSLDYTNEGGESVPRPLSTGVTLRKLVVQTVDEAWMPTYVKGETGSGKPGDSGGGYVHKLATVDGLAVYCDGPSFASASSAGPMASPRNASSVTSSGRQQSTNEGCRETVDGHGARRSFLSSLVRDEDLKRMFKDSLDEGQRLHQYVVIPVSPSFRTRIQRGGENGGGGGGAGGTMFGGARCKVEAMFNEVGVVLNNAQIANMNKMRSTLRDLERWEAFYRHRPKHSIKDDPKAWWVFLVKCVSRPDRAMKRAKLGWLDVVRLVRLRKTYVRLYIARARHQATPEEYQQFTRLDEQLTPNEIVAFRLKAIAELEEEEALQSVVPLPQHPQRQTWREWLLRRSPTSASSSGEVGRGATYMDPQSDEAAAQAEFLDAFAPSVDLDGEEEVDPNRVLWDVEVSLNEGTLTLVNGKQPCLRIIFDLMAVLKKKKTDWHLELGLGSLQAFGLGQAGGRATTLVTRRTWRPHNGGRAGSMIQIGDFQVWKSGGITVEYRSVADQDPVSSLTENEGSEDATAASGATTVLEHEKGSSAVIICLDFAPHQVIHSRSCIEQVSSMLATQDMRLLTSAAQSRISRLRKATRSSFLQAIGGNLRFEVTADIHAPLLVLPDNTKESFTCRTSVLLLDLGHIAFRRDDTRRGREVDLSVVESVEGSVQGSGNGRDDDPSVSRDDWRLDISGVQAVVADASSFAQDTGTAGVSEVPHQDTAIVEEFDLFVKIITSTDVSTNRLLGIGLEASLPRLSFNIHSSAYQLLSRLLKYELKRSSPGMDKGVLVQKGTSLSSLATSETVVPATTTPVSGSLSGTSQASETATMASSTRVEIGAAQVPASPSSRGIGGMGRSVCAVLSSEPEPVTEVPGEGPEDADDIDDREGVIGVGGTFRRRSGNFNYRRSSVGRRSSLGSAGCVVGPERRGLGDHLGEDQGDLPDGDLDAQGDEGGLNAEEFSRLPSLTLDVQVMAPVISVLFVHDDRNISLTSAAPRGVSVKGRDEEATPQVAPSQAEGDAVVGTRDMRGRIQGRQGGENGRAVEGALVLLEIRGLEVGCRGSPSDTGDIETSQEESKDDPEDTTRNTEFEAKRSLFELAIASFLVQDMHQQVGAEFSHLLSSSSPSSQTAESQGGVDRQGPSQGGEEFPLRATGVANQEVVEKAVRITYAMPEGGRPSRTLVTLAALWANWNPETVAALSIFAYGMYGKTDSARPKEEASGGSNRPNPETVMLDSTQNAPSPEAETVDDLDRSVQRSGSLIIFEMKKISLWLNKEIHGRRLLLLEAGTSSVTISKTVRPVGNLIKYEVILGSASIVDVGTRDSKWRMMVEPSSNPALPPQEVRLSLTQDSGNRECPLSVHLALQSCVLYYLNETWLEAVDYVLHGVLGDGPWCPWRLTSTPEDSLDADAGNGSSPQTAPFNKRAIAVEVSDPEVKLPAGHMGDGWVALLGKRLVASNSYEERSSEDGCDWPPELCQVWSVKLDGVRLRSSRMGGRHRRGPGLDPALLAESGETARNGSSLLEDELSARSLTVEARWPALPRTVPGPVDGGEARSTYVVAGEAPGLNLRLHADDYALLMQVVSDNIGGEKPCTSDGRKHRTACGRDRDREHPTQMVAFPYEIPPPVGATFDISFSLPDISIAAANTTAMATTQSGLGEYMVSEIGAMRSRALVWRMRRLAGGQVRNEVRVEEPHLTENVPGDGTRELFGGNVDFSAPLSQFVPLSTRASATSRTLGEPRGKSPLVGISHRRSSMSHSSFTEGVVSRSHHCFRWLRQTWPDGGRTNTFAIDGGKILLSKRGWNAWRLWAGAANVGPSHSRGEAKGDGSDVTSKVPNAPDDPCVPNETGRGSTDVGKAAISDDASYLDLKMSGTSLVLEPWDYGCDRDDYELDGTRGQDRAHSTNKVDAEPCIAGIENEGAGGGPVVAVRIHLEFMMSSGLFLEGRWAAELRSECSSNMVKTLNNTADWATFAGIGESLGKCSPRTSVVMCQVSSMEAFSHPAADRPRYPLHGYRATTEGADLFPTPTASVDESPPQIPRPAGTHSSPPNTWRPVLEKTSGSIRYFMSPPTISDPGTSSLANDLRVRRRSSFWSRQVFFDGWRRVRVVLRPSDIRTVARVLGDNPQRSTAQTRSGNAQGDPQATSPVAIDLRAHGEGILVRLEDDSGSHFVPPPRTALLPEVGKYSASSDTPEDLWGDKGAHVGQQLPRPALDEDVNFDYRGAMGDPSGREQEHGYVRPVYSPPHPIVDIQLSRWELRYSKCHLEGRGGPGADRQETEKGTAMGISMTLRISEVRVTDLMQRVPCHEAFSELLRITPQSSVWQDWLDDETDQDEEGDGSHHRGQKVGDRESSELPPDCNHHVSGSGSEFLSGGLGKAALVLQYNSDPAGMPDTKSEGEVGEEFDHVDRSAARKGAAMITSVELGPVAANWNPRTLVALWAVRAALVAAARCQGQGQGHGDKRLSNATGEESEDGVTRDIEREVEGDDQASRKKPDLGSDGTRVYSWTEIRITARHGLEVMMNKEKEGRRLLVLSAKVLDLVVTSRAGTDATVPVPGAAASAIVWRGSLEDLRARDPRLSNARYSSLIEPISSDASPVVLNFRYSRRKGSHLSPRNSSTAERESPSYLGAWESAVLSIDFSEARVVYLQPLWLEAVDYLWEGVLGSAVWGGEVQEQDPPRDMAARRGSGGDGDGRGKKGVEQETKLEVEHGRVRTSSEIHISLADPRVVLPGRLVDPVHLVLQPKRLRYSTWIGGAHDRDGPPHIEDCSESGPEGRHMIVEAPGTEMYVGLVACPRSKDVCPEIDPTSCTKLVEDKEYLSDVPGRVTRRQASSSPVAKSKKGFQRATHASSDMEEANEYHRVLKEPADIHVSVITLDPLATSRAKTPSVSASVPFGQSPAGRKASSDLLETSQTSGNTPRVFADSSGALAKSSVEHKKTPLSFDSPGTPGSGVTGGAPGQPEKVMRIRVFIPRLEVKINPTTRAALAHGINSNLLAAGFVGEYFENFPLGLEDTLAPGNALRIDTRCVSQGGNELASNMSSVLAERYAETPSSLPIPLVSPNAAPGASLESCSVSNVMGAIPSVACTSCGTRFEDGLSAQHQCTWCAGVVRRGCLHTMVSADTVSAFVGHDGRNNQGSSTAQGGRDGGPGSIALVCDTCAAVAFPEFSVHPKAALKFRYGDDGLVTAMEVAVDIPKVHAEFMPEASSEGGTVGEGGGSIACDCEGLDLMYGRSGRRLGGVEISVESVTITDLSPDTAFPQLLAPAPQSAIGELRPPQIALSYHFAPKSEVKVQVMVNHLETVVGPSVINKLSSIFKSTAPPTCPPPEASRDPTEKFPAGTQQKKEVSATASNLARSGAPLLGMYDQAALQVVPRDRDVGRTPLTLKLTLSNPVVMIPQDDEDPESNALFLQGLIIANYVRSPRREKGHQSSREKHSVAEARDTSLEIFRLESQVGRRASSYRHGATHVPMAGLGNGAGSVDPITLSLHYSEVERPLHPLMKDIKCQIEEVACQFTYQEIALIKAMLSGWSSKLSLLKESTNESGAAAEADECQQQGRPLSHIHGGEQSPALDEEFYGLGDDVVPFPEGNGRLYKVVFETRQLGLVLIKQDGVPVVEQVTAYNGVGGKAAGPFPGDELVGVAGESVSTLTYDGVINRIRASPRPLTLVFRRALFECWWGREFALDFSSWDGNHLDGVFLVGGGAGDQAVVGSADAYQPPRRSGVLKAKLPPIIPRPGALVVSINSTPVSHLSLASVTAMLDELERSKMKATAERTATVKATDPSRKLSGADGGSRGSGSSGTGSDGKKIRVLLREVDVQAWPPNWRTEIQCRSVRMTVIDDRDGRDMPLVRAEVGSLDITHESGSGMVRWAADSRMAKEMMTGEQGSDSEGPPLLPVSRTTAGCDAQVDYYHARGGRWEPLLERVVAQGDREVVAHRDPQGAEPSGGIGARGKLSSVVRVSCSQEDVKVNVTHAALDVILRACRDWRNFQETSQGSVSKLSTSGGFSSSAGHAVGEQPATGIGASEGAGTGGAGSAQQRYSPFLLQNRTGLPLKFWAHQDKVDIPCQFGRKGTLVEGTADLSFNPSSGVTPSRWHRRHDSWFLSLHLMSEVMKTEAIRTGEEQETIPREDRGPHFLNLPLKEIGQHPLECVLWTENIGGGAREDGKTGRVRRCNAIWEVALENGRHKLTLRSALQVLNLCGAWLEVRCSTDAFTSRGSPDHRKQEIVGTIAPGGRLALPLRWSHAEDIRLRPIRNQQRHGHACSAKQSHLLPLDVWDTQEAFHDNDLLSSSSNSGAQDDLGGDSPNGSRYEFSDCPLLVPVARAGEKEQGLTMSVIPWVACNPSRDPSGAPGPSSNKSLFLFLEGLGSTDLEGAKRAGSRVRSASYLESSGEMHLEGPASHRRDLPISDEAKGVGMNVIRRDPGVPSHRPLEAVVYASLSFRNLLCMGVGWRVWGVRDDPSAKIAEGWLEPGEGAHVLEANTMAMAPSLSFKVPGFEWTQPRQLSPAELSRNDRDEEDSGTIRGRWAGEESADKDGANSGRRRNSELALETIPCHNSASQIFYLSVEASTPRVNSVLVTIFAGFWVRNLSGLPLTLGEPIPSGLSAAELQEERLADQRDRTRRRSPSPPRQSLFDVLLSAVQPAHPVTEEVFELRMAAMRRDGRVVLHDVRWCSAEGNARPPYDQVRLPSIDAWEWQGEWSIDRSGDVSPDSPSIMGGGWESCSRKSRGGQYGSNCFSSSRKFTISDPVWRRRWWRRRVPRRQQASQPCTPYLETSTKPPITEQEESNGKSVIYQPALSVLHNGSAGLDALGGVGKSGRSSRAGLCVRVDGSAWSRPLNIAVQGAGAPFQVPGGRWPVLKQTGSSLPHTSRRFSPDNSGMRRPGTKSNSTSSGVFVDAKGVLEEARVGVYELAYDVSVAPAPWNRTRVITITSRYTVANRCENVLVVKQHGSDVTMELEPGESRALHWADSSLEPMLSVTLKTGEDYAESSMMNWSGPIGIANIGTFPICVRPRPGGASLPADSASPASSTTMLRSSSSPSSSSRSPSSGATSSTTTTTSNSNSNSSSPLSSPPLGDLEGMSMVGANRVLRVDVNIGRHAHAHARDDEGDESSRRAQQVAGGYRRSSAVQVAFQEETWETGDRFPTYRLENRTGLRMFYGQASSVHGPGDALPPGRSSLFGWDQPCPVEERAQGVLNLSLLLAPEPLSSPEGRRLAKTLNIRKLWEKVVLMTRRGRVEVVVEPDGPSKVIRMYTSKASSLLPSPRATPATPTSAIAPGKHVGKVHSSHFSSRSTMQTVTRRYRTPSPSPTNASRGAWGSTGASAYIPSPNPASSIGLKRSTTHPSWAGGATPASRMGVSPAHRSAPTGNDMESGSTAPAGDTTRPTPGSGAPGPGSGSGPAATGGRSGEGREVAKFLLQKLHVFCRAVRVSIIDGELGSLSGEMVLGSLEGMSMSVAATARELDVNLNIRSLQVDSHMPGTRYPVILQPVRTGHGGGDKKCMRFALVAAPHVQNVTYIKLASLEVGEFDLRLDEDMVRWAQGLADRLLWTLVAERRADEMSTWPLPVEAFCSQDASLGNIRKGSKLEEGVQTEGKVSSGGINTRGKFVRRYVYLEVFQISAIKVRLSLQRAKESPDTVYVGVKPGQMLLDLIGRMDSAHIKLGPLIVHNATTTRQRLKMTAREHYERELKQQAFLALGSLEALGNPVGLLRGMGQGMQDFVKEPVMGLLRSVEDAAPEELVVGVARGAGSLLRHSVGGVANSVSLITGTVSQNLTTLAMDKEYKIRRAKRKEARGENRDILDGLGSAGGSLARGLTDGVSGLISNPMRGAERDGIAGFAKGVGTGVLGLVMKPAVGVADAATDVLQGVKGTTDSLARLGQSSPAFSASASSYSGYSYQDEHSSLGEREGGIIASGMGGESWDDGLSQVRPRRVLYGREKALRPYLLEDALTAALLQVTRYRDEQYVAHLDLGPRTGRGGTPSNVVLILTETYILVLLAPAGEVVLEERLDRVQVVEKTSEGVLLHLRTGTNSGRQVSSKSASEDDGYDGRRRVRPSLPRGIACSNEGLRKRLHDVLDTAVKNATRD